MMDIQTIIVFLFLLVISIIDFKTSKIPSVLLTSMIFVSAFLNPSNLFFGILGFILAYLLWEADFFSGVADIKTVTFLSFTLSSVSEFLLFTLLFMLIGVFWKIFWVGYFNKKKKKIPDEFPFIPVFLISYTIFYLIIG